MGIFSRALDHMAGISPEDRAKTNRIAAEGRKEAQNEINRIKRELADLDYQEKNELFKDPQAYRIFRERLKDQLAYARKQLQYYSQ